MMRTDVIGPLGLLRQSHDISAVVLFQHRWIGRSEHDAKTDRSATAGRRLRGRRYSAFSVEIVMR